MKKILAMAICGSMILTAGCGSSATEPTQAATEATTTAEAASEGGEGAGTSGQEAAVTGGNLVISTFGLSEDITISDVYNPFTEKTGIEIVTDVGGASDRYTKLSANPNLEIDVMELSQSFAARGVAEGLFEAIDYSKVTNAEDLIPAAKSVADELGCAPYVINSVGIIYNPEAVGYEITGFNDLWNEDLKDSIAIPDITTTYGPAMVYIASDYKGVDIESDDGAAAFEALNELKPNVVKTYAKSSDLANMFASGEITAAVVGDFAVPVISEANPDVTYFAPNGTYANFNVLCVNKNAANKDQAYEYINYRLDAELQKKTASSLNEAPTNSTVTLTEEETGNMTYGEVAANAKALNYTFVNEILESWIDQWNRILNS
ncbi:MAG: ABC transporter substrate-binding protein [Lachnospiraceae bacterium]